MVSPARAAAFSILMQVERERAYAADLLHTERLDRLSELDRALCTQLVMGVLRWRARLDAALGALASQSLPRLDLEVLTALRLGAFQLGFLDRIPARAAVNESAELVRRAHKSSATGMVNAVLRRLAEKRELLEPLQPPGPKTVIDLSQLYSHPLWLVERWAAAFGLSTAEAICAYDQQPPPVAVRLRDPAAEAELQQQKIELGPGTLLRSARRVLRGDLTHTQAFADRRVVIQDEASQLIALLVGSGERLLDCCAAPGGKAAILAERSPGHQVIAMDLHPHRAALMQQLLAGRFPNVHVLAADAEIMPLRMEFDRVLADVPCSGTGTLARNPEIRWRLAPETLLELHQRQAAILTSALTRLSPGGRLVYSTCSLEPEENADVVNQVLEQSSEFRLCDCKLELERLSDEGELVWPELDSLLHSPFLQTLPGVHPADGFFAAIIERTA